MVFIKVLKLINIRTFYRSTFIYIFVCNDIIWEVFKLLNSLIKFFKNQKLYLFPLNLILLNSPFYYIFYNKNTYKTIKLYYRVLNEKDSFILIRIFRFYIFIFSNYNAKILNILDFCIY